MPRFLKEIWQSISIRDNAVRKDRKENFYHGILLGLLQYEGNWLIKSNAESGLGYSDLLIETLERIGVVIELKYAQDSDLEKHCAEAVAQIEKKQYAARLMEDGMDEKCSAKAYTDFSYDPETVRRLW